MYALFVGISLVGCAYFLLARRRFDFFSVGFFSAVFYFIPGFFGFVQYPRLYYFEEVRLYPQTYMVMVIVLAMVLIAGLLFDYSFRDFRPSISFAGTGYAAPAATSLAIGAFLIAVITIGRDLLLADKLLVMGSLNRWYTVSVTSASLGVVLSFQERRWKLFAPCVLILVVDLYVGFRALFVTTLLAVVVLHMARTSAPARLALRHWKTGVLVIAAAVSLTLYKGLSEHVKRGDMGSALTRLSQADFYSSNLKYSEPFVTQAILNEVLRRRFRVGLEHLGTILPQFLLFAPELGYDVVSFNNRFQPVLFRDSFWMGMANNIWAEAVSSGGWVFMAAFAALFAGSLGLGSYFLRCNDPRLRAGVVLLFTTWAFYIHRNDLHVQIGLEKRILLLFALSLLASMILAPLANSRKPAGEVGIR